MIENASRMGFAAENINLANSYTNIYSRKYPTGHFASAHRHEFLQIWYCTEGTYKHIIDGVEYICEPGSICVIPIGTLHQLPAAESPYSCCCINIRYDIFDAIEPEFPNTIYNYFYPLFAGFSENEFPHFIKLEGKEWKEANALINKLFDLSGNNQKYAIREFLFICEKIFSLPQFSHCPENPEISELFNSKILPVTRAMAYINIHYPEKISLADLVQHSLICQTNLCIYFKKVTSLPFSVYLQCLRLRHAIQLLGLTDHSISYISDVCGFSNSAHMISCFKKYEKTLPKNRRIVMKEYYKRNPL